MINVQLTEKQVASLRQLLDSYMLPAGTAGQQRGVIIAIDSISIAIDEGMVNAVVVEKKKPAKKPRAKSKAASS